MTFDIRNIRFKKNGYSPLVNPTRITEHIWPSSIEPVISICCITYNQVNYIRECIDGFLMQETTFPVEILIHDDASTDGTREIIQEYEEMFPSLIKPIFQEENQYLKKGFQPAVYTANHAKGKFIALCEGDDYWISANKLQYQVSEMEIHKEINFSFHSAYCLREGKMDKSPSWKRDNRSKVIPFTNIIEFSCLGPTPSYILSRHIFQKLPNWFFDKAPVGDVFFEIFGAKQGGALYINEPMAVYRVNAIGSFSNKIINRSGFAIEVNEKMIEAFLLLRKEMPSYKKIINIRISKLYFKLAIRNLDINEVGKFTYNIEKSIQIYSFYSMSQKIIFRFKKKPAVLKFMYNFYKLARYVKIKCIRSQAL